LFPHQAVSEQQVFHQAVREWLDVIGGTRWLRLWCFAAAVAAAVRFS